MALILIFAMSLPWNLLWLPMVLSTPINMDARTVYVVCPNHQACARSSGRVFISPSPETWTLCGGLKRTLNHELQHSLGYTSGLYANADWEGFCDVVAEMILYGDYDEHQRGTMRTMCYDPPELHADLPLLLGGKIPEDLAPWYPWFGGSNEYETDF